MRMLPINNYYNGCKAFRSQKTNDNTKNNKPEEQKLTKDNKSGISAPVAGLMLLSSLGGGYYVGNINGYDKAEKEYSSRIERTPENGYETDYGTILSFEEAKELTDIPPRKNERMYIVSDTVNRDNKQYIREQKYKVKEVASLVESEYYDPESKELMRVETYGKLYSYPIKSEVKDGKGNFIESKEFSEFNDIYGCPTHAVFIKNNGKTRTDAEYSVKLKDSKGPNAPQESQATVHKSKKNKSAKKDEIPKWERDLQRLLDEMAK